MDSTNEGASPDRPERPPDQKSPGGYERPDWLVGADELMASEIDRQEAEVARAETRKPAPAPPPVSPGQPAVSAAWSPATRPDLEVRGPGSSPVHDPPGLVSRIDIDDFRQDAEAASTPDLPPAPSAYPTEQAFAWADEAAEHETPARARPSPRPLATETHAGVAPKPKASSAWATAIKLIATDRRIHVAAVVVAITAMMVAFAKEQLSFTPVSHIRSDPVRFDGKPVKLRGTVAEVFAVGSSYTYYLLDGRDTIVVFTRSQPPQPHQRVTVEGSVSTGYLEGVPRAAVFQQETP